MAQAWAEPACCVHRIGAAGCAGVTTVAAPPGATDSFTVDFVVHRSSDIGSPRVSGSTNFSSSGHTCGSVVATGPPVLGEADDVGQCVHQAGGGKDPTGDDAVTPVPRRRSCAPRPAWR